MKFVIATGNEGKVREFKRILEPMGFSVSSLKEMGLSLDVEETGTTFAENARIKAREACRLTGLAAIADDSGLCVDALGGAPGVYSARYSGEGDDGNNQKLLRELADVPEKQRTGRYVCAISCIFPDQTELTAEGTCEGRIGYELSGDHDLATIRCFMWETAALASTKMRKRTQSAIGEKRCGCFVKN